MEIFLSVLLFLSCCLCGVVCARLYEANKRLEILSVAYGVRQKLVQAQNELIEKQKKYIETFVSMIGNEEKEVK